MKIHVLLTLAVVAGLQSASAEDLELYQPVEAPLPSWLEGALPGPSSLPSPHIVGGEEVQPHSYPHQVALFLKLTGPNGFQTGGFCGGSLISDSWVLTAAHCVDKRVLLKDPTGINADKYELSVSVVVGAHNYTDKEALGVQTAVVAQVVINPEWSLLELANDLALLRLENAVTLDGEYAKPIRLPKVSQKDESFDKHEVTMTGWGVTKRTNTKPSPVLNSVNSTVVGNLYCNFRYLFVLVKSTNICASGWGWKGTCYGDSGGPMIVREADNEITLIGITSFGIGCSWGFPSVFTRVSSYLDWIHKTSGIAPRYN